MTTSWPADPPVSRRHKAIVRPLVQRPLSRADDAEMALTLVFVGPRGHTEWAISGLVQAIHRRDTSGAQRTFRIREHHGIGAVRPARSRR